MTEYMSRTFWYCKTITHWPDVIDILFFIFEIQGILINLFTVILLFRLHHGPRLSVRILQTLTIHCLLVCVVNLLEDVNPFGVNTSNALLNLIVCIFWDSRFFYWVFEVSAIQCTVLFACDRLIILRNWDQMRYTSDKRRLLCYEVFIHTFSILFTCPQFLTVNLQNGECNCAPTTVNMDFLTVIYGHVFVWFICLFVIDGALLLCSAYLIAKWVKETPLKQQFDELNAVTFDEKHKAKVIGMGRKTASLCVIPLAISHVLTFSYDSIYQFLSAAGVTTFVINSPAQKVGGLLIVVNANLVPIILIAYLPPLQEFTLKLIRAPFKICRKVEEE